MGRNPYALAMLYGNLNFAKALEAAGHGQELGEVERIFADCAKGRAPVGRPLAHMALGDEERLILTRDSRLIRRREARNHLFIRSQAVEEQLRQVLEELELRLLPIFKP